ncbi:LysR family transcriptional regulator [Pelagibius sp. 7325]|uniref:LysR family transcriptional regulator n=1 Tax=Pelagibius sp. 7325 TaxID=3131994 RepID=UPI0030EC5EEE
MPSRKPPASLPPLEWLRVFEAAGRSGSFTAAAAELGLTQAAVSQRMRNLETRLDVRLFVRKPRGIELTADGEAYLPHVQSALTALQRSTADLFAAPRRKITIATPSSVAQLWIAPRLAGLARALPNLQVALGTVQRPADYDIIDGDFEVRFGSGAWPRRRAVPLFDEVLAPVAAPALLKAAPDWRMLPQIAVAGPRDGWLEWASAAGTAPPRPPSLRFDTFVHALAAALDGAGVLLASLALIEPQLRSGALRRLPEPESRMQTAYWLAWREEDAGFAERGGVVACLSAPRASVT